MILPKCRKCQLLLELTPFSKVQGRRNLILQLRGTFFLEANKCSILHPTWRDRYSGDDWHSVEIISKSNKHCVVGLVHQRVDPFQPIFTQDEITPFHHRPSSQPWPKLDHANAYQSVTNSTCSDTTITRCEPTFCLDARLVCIAALRTIFPHNSLRSPKPPSPKLCG